MFKTVIILMVAISLSFSNNIRTIDVKLKNDAPLISQKGSIKGYNLINYRITAKAGQTLKVFMQRSKGSAYFNVVYPQRPYGGFNGSTYGDAFAMLLPKDGIYTVQVYMMRSAARRNEISNFTMKFSLTGKGAVIDLHQEPKKFKASGTVPCGNDKAKMKQQCDFRVLRYLKAHSAELWVKSLDQKTVQRYNHFYFINGMFGSHDIDFVEMERIDDNTIIKSKNNEFYTVPDAAVYGG